MTVNKEGNRNPTHAIEFFHLFGFKHLKSRFLLFDERFGGIQVIINVDGKQFKSFGFVCFVQGDEVRKLRTTGPSPTGPKIEHDHLSFE